MTKSTWRWGGIAALLLYLFFGDSPGRSPFWQAFFNAGHAPLFGVIAVLIYGLLPSDRFGGVRRGWAAFGLTVALGALTEVLQTLQARGDPSVEDLLRDTAGASAFLLLACSVRPAVPSVLSSPRWRRVGAALLAVLILAAAGWALMRTTAAYVARNRAVPRLYALDGTWWESRFIQADRNRLMPGALRLQVGEREDFRLARLDLEPDRYSGISFAHMYPDWRGYRQLALIVYSDLPAPLPMVIRVHDARHANRFGDRFNRDLTIRPGLNRLVIPLDDIRHAPQGREMDMSRIRGIGLFTVDLAAPIHLYLGAIRLE
jgi:VanZ family protein